MSPLLCNELLYLIILTAHNMPDQYYHVFHESTFLSNLFYQLLFQSLYKHRPDKKLSPIFLRFLMMLQTIYLPL